jgi:hypothetical protein
MHCRRLLHVFRRVSMMHAAAAVPLVAARPLETATDIQPRKEEDYRKEEHCPLSFLSTRYLVGETAFAPPSFLKIPKNESAHTVKLS